MVKRLQTHIKKMNFMRYLFLLGLLISNVWVKAQLVKNEKKIGWRGGEANVKLISFPNKDRSLNCVVLSKPDSIMANVYDDKLNVVYSFATKNPDPYEGVFAPIGGFFSNNFINIVTKQNGTNIFNCINFNNTTSEIKLSNTEINTKGKRFVTSVNTGNNFFQIFINKSAPILYVYSTKNDNTFTEQVFELNKDLNTGLTDKEMLSVLSTESRFKSTLIDKDIVTSADVAVLKSKIYLNNDTLTLAIDDVYSETKVFNLNLSNNKVKYQITSHILEKDSLGNIFSFDEALENIPKSYNSIIIENILYHVFVTPDILKFSATKLDDNQLLFVYKTNVTDDIDYKNTSILQEGTSVSSTQTKQLTTTQFFRKILGGSAVISGIKNKNNMHQLTIGGYKKLATGSGMGAFGGMGAMGMIGSGMMSFGGVGFSRNWDKVTRFKTLFDPLTSKHVKGEVNDDDTELIKEYVQNVTMPFEGDDIFYCNGNSYYTYYDNLTKNLVTIMLK
ncbi:MAG: hypothetical protein EAZ51_09820 [Sphingobacteriales bacterium]|nr:MAG: hypothetical protein EAZ64_01185 [Sphingobacteriales bacterium]TAF78272.1 MAG: hypothetical protein EAZ51_09820 [Sphingobacteriales bacterium]